MFARRPRTSLAAAILAAVAVTLAATAIGVTNASGAGPTGSAAAIELFESVAANTNAQRAIELAQSGYMTMRTTITPTSFAYEFGYGGVPKGYVRADEAITYAQHDGKVVWVRDVLTADPRSCARDPACVPGSSLELFVTKHAAFAGDVDEPNGIVGCYERESFDDVPYRAGGPWFTPVGDFRNVRTHGNQALLTITYAWPDGQRVTEHDSIDLAAQLFAAATIHVARGSKSTELALGISEQDTALTTTPHAPRVALCR